MGWNQFPWDLQEIYCPTEPLSLARGALIEEIGCWRISRRNCELHSVKIIVQGSCALLELQTGTGRPLFRQPSCFTGSWPLGCFSEEGLIVISNGAIPPTVQVSFHELTSEL